MMKLISLSLLVFALLGYSILQICCAEVPELSFKGIALGKATEKEISEKFKGAKRYGSYIFAKPNYHADANCGTLAEASKNSSLSKCRSEVITSQLFRIGETSAGEFVFLDKDGVVEEVTASFSTSSFSAVVAALTEKYGKPTSREIEQVQSKLGTGLDSLKAVWKLTDGTILVKERSGKIDTMSLQISTNKISNARREETEKSIKDAAKEL